MRQHVNDEGRRWMQAHLVQAYALFDEQLADGRPWLAGERYSVLDIYLWATMWQDRTGVQIAHLPHLPHLAAWTARVEARPAVQRTLADEDRLVAAHAARQVADLRIGPTMTTCETSTADQDRKTGVLGAVCLLVLRRRLPRRPVCCPWASWRLRHMPHRPAPPPWWPPMAALSSGSCMSWCGSPWPRALFIVWLLRDRPASPGASGRSELGGFDAGGFDAAGTRVPCSNGPGPSTAE